MSKNFLEPIILKSANEKLIREVFSKRNKDIIRKYDAIKRPKLKRQLKKRKLKIDDII